MSGKKWIHLYSKSPQAYHQLFMHLKLNQWVHFCSIILFKFETSFLSFISDNLIENLCNANIVIQLIFSILIHFVALQDVFHFICNFRFFFLWLWNVVCDLFTLPFSLYGEKAGSLIHLVFKILFFFQWNTSQSVFKLANYNNYYCISNLLWKFFKRNLLQLLSTCWLMINAL